MANFTNLPERHYVDKAKKLSFGDQDSDTYFDGETLDEMLTAISDLQKKAVELLTTGAGLSPVTKIKQIKQNGTSYTPRYLVYRTITEADIAVAGMGSVKLLFEMFTAATAFSPIVTYSLNAIKEYVKTYGINVSNTIKRMPCSGYFYKSTDDGLKYYPINQITVDTDANTMYVTTFIDNEKIDLTLPASATQIKGSSTIEWIS